MSIGRVAVVAIAIAAALACAGPAIAADDPALPPPMPSSPPGMATATQSSQAEPDPLSTPAPAIPSPPELDVGVPPITVEVTEDGAGSVDVSVRVLSPEDDESARVQGSEPSVVSPSPEADITGASTTSWPSSTEDGANAAGAGSNVNVSIRVLSPGDNGDVKQTDVLGGGIDALAPPEVPSQHAAAGDDDGSSLPSDGTADSSVGSKGFAENADQYHEQDSRYQSDSHSEAATWHWVWYLALDCDGNVLSESEETGAESSRDWAWEWTWEWSCDSPARPPPIDVAAPQRHDDLSESGPTRSDETSAPATADSEVAAEGEPWLWSWTFTFCGETVSATIPISTRTQLQWQWNWTWGWTCEVSASEPSSTASEGSAPSPSVHVQQENDAPGARGATGLELDGAMPMPDWLYGIQLPRWVIPRLSLTEFQPVLPTELAFLGDTFGATTIAVAVDLEILLPPPFDPAVAQTEAGEDATTIGPTVLISPPLVGRARPAIRAGRETVHSSSSDEWNTTRASSTRPHHPGTLKPAAQRSASGHERRLPFSPWRLPSHGSSGLSGASSSFVPTGSVLGTAALVAFFVLAAPTLARRIRVPRELSPRGTHGSSIDHPG